MPDPGQAFSRISVVTATLNRRESLRRAIESVIDQADPDFEHIIVDGMSTDRTGELLAEYQHLRVIREPDDGVYDAWNKGIALASGHWIYILNSDDEVPPGAFQRIRNALTTVPDAELVSGSVEVWWERAGQTTKRLISSPAMIALREQDIGPGIPLTNGRCYARSLLERVGHFDCRYKLVADRDFLLRMLLAKPAHVQAAGSIYRYHAHSGSLTLSGDDARARLAQEALDAASNGMREAKTPEHAKGYRRWHAWARAYLLHVLAFQGCWPEVGRSLVQAFRADILWPMRLPTLVARHIRERAARRGRLMT